MDKNRELKEAAGYLIGCGGSIFVIVVFASATLAVAWKVFQFITH